MTYYVTQFGTYFFSIRRVQGYSGRMIFNGTKVSSNEQKTLLYSRPERTVTKANSNFDTVNIQGNANEILGRELATVH